MIYILLSMICLCMLWSLSGAPSGSPFYMSHLGPKLGSWHWPTLNHNRKAFDRDCQVKVDQVIAIMRQLIAITRSKLTKPLWSRQMQSWSRWTSFLLTTIASLDFAVTKNNMLSVINLHLALFCSNFGSNSFLPIKTSSQHKFLNNAQFKV